MALPVTLWEEREKREGEKSSSKQVNPKWRPGEAWGHKACGILKPLTGSSKTFAETGTFPFRL